MESSSLVLDQFYSFLESLILGLALGVCFDLYRALRLQQKRRRLTVFSVISDCLFWLGAAVACILVIMARRWGEIYLYTYLSLVLGFIAYIYFVSRFLLPLWMRLFSCIIRVVTGFCRIMIKACRIAVAPFFWVYGAVRRGGIIFSQFLSRIFTGGCRRTG